MSEASDSQRPTSGLVESQTQTATGDEMAGDTTAAVDDISVQTFPSILQSHCSYPTELFYTLSPISLSQITSESTPIVNRSEPIGGEDRHQRLQQQRQHMLRTYDIQTIDLSGDEPTARQSAKSAADNSAERPPLIGRTNSTSGSSRSTVLSVSQKSDEQSTSGGIQDAASREDRDALASKVRQLLGKTKQQTSDEFDNESLGLIHDFDAESSVVTIDSLRSEPDGRGRPLVLTQTAPKIVYYSSSEEEEEVSDSTSHSTQKFVAEMKDNPNVDNNLRLRSYSLSSGTAVKSSGFDISLILQQRMQRMQTKDNTSVKESSETQTNRSFLAEIAVQKSGEKDFKRPMDVSKAIQTSDSLTELNVQKKGSKESSSQTNTSNTSFGISLLLKELLKTQQTSRRVSAGTQTLRSYLTEQALRRKNREIRDKTKQNTNHTPEVETRVKGIQTSYTSSCNSETPSPVIVNRRQDFEYTDSRHKEPISWYISVDNNNNSKSVSQSSRTHALNSRTITKSKVKCKPKEVMTTDDNINTESLQEAFNRKCVDMRLNSQIRVNRIQTISDIRKRTADERLIQMAKQFIRQQESAKVIKANVIQPVFKSSIKRFFTHEEMRAQTEKIYCNLPEVKAMKEKKKQKEREKNQKLLAQIYKYKLKDNALKGRLSWKITQSCLN